MTIATTTVNAAAARMCDSDGFDRAVGLWTGGAT